jgi:hypothetical protein
MDIISNLAAEISKWLGIAFAGISIYFLKKFVQDNDEKIKNLETDVAEIKEGEQVRWQKVHSDLAVVQTTLSVMMSKLDEGHIIREKMYEKIDKITERVFEQEKKLELALQHGQED